MNIEISNEERVVIIALIDSAVVELNKMNISDDVNNTLNYLTGVRSKLGDV